MSHRPISRSPDLRRLRDEGYDVQIKSGYVVLQQIPYVTADKKVARGILVDKLNAANDVAQAPSDHTVWFCGEMPCNSEGVSLEERYVCAKGDTEIEPGVRATLQFSRKLANGESYKDFHHKMTAYADMLCNFAQSIDSSVSAIVWPVVPPVEDDSVFLYEDTASSRANIVEAMKKLAMAKVAIVGLGGTGAYVLDLVAKTPVREIHLFDGDAFLQHNAFRSPGATSGAELEAKTAKVEYFKSRYSQMRTGIVAVASYIDEESVAQLGSMNFVFVCMDAGEPKRNVVKYLEASGLPFVDVGMGLQLVDGALCGQLRTTFSTSAKRQHVWDNKRISFAPAGMNNEYATNIQVADLNALNAALAVVKWKKHCGFYHDLEREFNSTYQIDGNHILNEDQ
jgi:hypothetical protein